MHVMSLPPCWCTVNKRVLISWVCYDKPTRSPRHCHWNPLGKKEGGKEGEREGRKEGGGEEGRKEGRTFFLPIVNKPMYFIKFLATQSHCFVLEGKTAWNIQFAEWFSDFL